MLDGVVRGSPYPPAHMLALARPRVCGCHSLSDEMRLIAIGEEESRFITRRLMATLDGSLEQIFQVKVVLAEFSAVVAGGDLKNSGAGCGGVESVLHGGLYGFE